MTSDEIVIRVTNLSKCYQIYNRPQDRIKQVLYAPVLRLIGKPSKRYYREFWALKDVAFEIRSGETVGVVGRNGSGKSTLLQLIAGTLSPTSGHIVTTGRIAALLELGSGFNPDFTGKENIYLNAAILGLSKQEINDCYNDIVAFSEMAGYIDQPIKTYSSGMLVRLAFSVAISVDPKILIVDEALAVGDELFQRKCLSRIEDMRSKGAAVLFVSHSGSQVIELCDRALLIDDGELLVSGDSKNIVGLYQKLMYAPKEMRVQVKDSIRSLQSGADIADLNTNTAIGDSEFNSVRDSFDPSLKPSSTIVYESNGALISHPRLFDNNGHEVNLLTTGSNYRYVYEVKFSQLARYVRFGMLIKTLSGVEIGGGVSALEHNESISQILTNQVYRVEFDFVCSLNPGTYFLNAGVSGDLGSGDVYLHRITDFYTFKVLSDGPRTSTGIVDFSCRANYIEINNE